MRRVIIYYSHNRIAPQIQNAALAYLDYSAGLVGVPIISVTHQPVKIGRNIVLPKMKTGIKSIFMQIKIGIQNTDAEIICLAEHDVLYPPDYFNCPDPTTSAYLYHTNVINLDKDGYNKTNPIKLSGLIAKAKQLSDYCSYQIDVPVRVGKIEPVDGENKREYEQWFSDTPRLNLRHGRNTTLSKRGEPIEGRINYWGNASQWKFLFET